MFSTSHTLAGGIYSNHSKLCEKGQKHSAVSWWSQVKGRSPEAGCQQHCHTPGYRSALGPLGQLEQLQW